MSPRCDLNPPMINFHIFIMFIVLDIVCTATKNLIWITYFYYNSNGSGCPNSIYGCASPKSSNSELKLKKTIKLAKCCCIIFAILWYPLQRSTPLKPLDRSLRYYINMAYSCMQFKVQKFINLAKRRPPVVICCVRWSALGTFYSGEPRTPHVPAI